MNNDGVSPFAAPLMDAVERLVAQILGRWAIPAHRVIAHSDLAPGRKTDPGARFDWANLAGACLSHARLMTASLTHAHLRGAALKGANLRAARLTHANLMGADMTGANLWQADLSGANLCGATCLWGEISKACFAGALYDEATRLPPGFHPGAEGMICFDMPRA